MTLVFPDSSGSGPVREEPFMSILIPTRDRAELLRDALDSIFAQTDGDFEVIVADNASSDQTGIVAGAYGDRRIRISRSDRALGVTENWTRALEASRGRFVIMLGDDDALLPTYVARIRELSKEFPNAEVIYHGTWLYAAPGVDPSKPGGYMHTNSSAEFLRSATSPAPLSHSTRTRMVGGALDFRCRYGFNMQFVALRRSYVARTAEAGPLFVSEFPDYFAMNAAFLTAYEVLAVPEDLAVIGVSRKSYGFYHLNRREDEGREFLQGSEQSEPEVGGLAEMPGSYINAGWLSAMVALEERYGERLPRSASRGRYCWLQAVTTYRAVYWDGIGDRRDIEVVDTYLSPLRRLACRAVFGVGRLVGRLLPQRIRISVLGATSNLLSRQFPLWAPEIHDGFPSMGEAIAWASQRGEPCGHRSAER